ncbi:TPR repeat-containing protein [Calothrix sp. NIES-4071]|nr:TPR repeat-containing protein [Calothrix sp. NIES-4071]BAZ56300.1 TPR repeat-containing protein [Calothrix sp. NIES-4105]
MRPLKVYLTTLAVLLVSSFSFSTSAIALPTTTTVQTQSNRSKADQLIQQGNQQYQAGQLQAAILSWQEARRIYQQLHERQGEGTALASLGAAYIYSQRYREAITTLESFLPIAQFIKDRRLEAQALGNLGIAYRAVGNYSKAIELHRQAGKILRGIGERSLLGKVLLNLGNTFSVLGDYDNATIAYQQSLKIAQQTKDREGEGIALGNLGKVYTDLGKYQDGIAAHKQSLAIAQVINNRSAQAGALINLGSTYLSLGGRTKAIDAYKQALEIASSAGERQREGEALGSLGIVYVDARNYPQAIKYQKQALAIARALGDPAASGLALNNLGQALYRAGKLKEAESQLRAAVKLLDNLRPGLSDTYKVSIFDTQVYTYNLLQEILIAAKKPEAALEASEQGRARAFAELLSRRIYEEDNKHASVSSITSLPEANSSPNIAKIRQIAQQQNATLVEYTFVPDRNFKSRGKQRAREEELFIWVVQPTGKVAFRRVNLKPLWQKGGTFTDAVRISRCLIFNLTANCGPLTQAIRQLKHTNNPTKSTRSQDYRQILHQFLIEPIADLLPADPNARVIFIPQESLFLVSFPALQDEDGKYLIEKHTILTAPSIQVLQLTHTLKARRRKREAEGNSQINNLQSSALIVGNPIMPKIFLQPGQPLQQLPELPEAEQEALNIAKLLNTTAIVRDSATKANILKKMPTARLVHLATHGLLEYGSQSNIGSMEGLGVPGAIALAPSPSDDGLLSASEIINLRLQAELVVLSACQTGEGRISGDGVIGLSRSFISAGVESVVVSLWAVRDVETSKLMKYFYQTLQQNPDKASALRQAMLMTMKEKPEPLYWAAFTLIGES